MKKVFISEKRLQRFIQKGKITVFDTRDIDSFNDKKIISSTRVSPNTLKREIFKHVTKDYILLVGKELRTNAGAASWARYEGYKHVYLLDKHIDKIDNKKIAQFK